VGGADLVVALDAPPGISRSRRAQWRGAIEWCIQGRPPRVLLERTLVIGACEQEARARRQLVDGRRPSIAAHALRHAARELGGFVVTLHEAHVAGANYEAAP
jgi:hypothetical protein